MPASASALLRIRPYHSADAAATRRVFSRAVKVTAAAHYSPAQVAAWASGTGSLSRWDAERSAHHTFVAICATAQAEPHGGAPEGTGVAREHEGGTGPSTDTGRHGERIIGYVDFRESGYIDHLFVDPDHGRAGVGTALLQAAIAHADDLGCTLLTAHASLLAIPVFERQGFAIDHRESAHKRGQTFERALMRRDVRRAK